MVKPIDPKAIADGQVRKLKKDTFAQIWVLFAAVLVAMTLFFKASVKSLIIVSILFMLFWYVEPVIFGATGKTVTTYLSKGQKVPRWKRFPLFFLAIVALDLIYTGIQELFDIAFPETSVNLVFVLTWLGFLFLMWVYIFSKESEL